MTRRNILITGASSGLGRGLAHEFASRGRDLALCARRLDRLEQVRLEITSEFPGVKVLIRQLDVTDPDAVDREFTALADELGSLDRIVVNAGLGFGSRIGEGDYASNAAVLQTNVLGALAQSESGMRILRSQNQGHLVLMSSAAAFRGMSGDMAAYAASKAALASLGEGLSIDVFGSPITVTTLLPGYIRTEMNEHAQRKLPFIIDADTGARLLAAAIEREPTRAIVPRMPWGPISSLTRRLPIRILARTS